MSNNLEDKKGGIVDDDNELVLLSKNGDLDAFEKLVNKYQKKMLNIAYRMTGCYDDACDIVQDAFVSAYKDIRNFEGRSGFSTWLYSITVNFSRNRLKKIKSESNISTLSTVSSAGTEEGRLNIDVESNEPSALETLERREIQQKVQDCINALENDYRTVIVLRDIQGFSYSEISDILKIAEGTVKSRLFRAREILKDGLKKTIGGL